MIFSKGIQVLLTTVFVSALVLTLSSSRYTSQEIPELKNRNILVYTKNGKGYVHENIPSAIACIKKLGGQHSFNVDASEDPAIFSTQNLKKYAVIIFASTNNDVFDTDEQRVAFRKYIESGGGFVGIHSVVGTERNWKWFKNMVGGTFVWHPKYQSYKIVIVDPKHPSVSGMPDIWKKEDECYFQKEMNPAIQTIMAHDLTSLNKTDSAKIATSAGPYTQLYPAVWSHQFDGGSVWVTALGHDKKDYEDEVFIRHLLNGITFVASRVKKLNVEKAYATTKDDAIRIEKN